jgi:hypothetical protein
MIELTDHWLINWIIRGKKLKLLSVSQSISFNELSANQNKCFCFFF